MSEDIGQRRRRHDEPVGDRLPPHSIEAEQGVLGCVLIAPAESLALARTYLRGAGWFYDLRHQQLWGHLCAMDDAHAPVDLITIQQRLKDEGSLESVGGLPYLSSLMDAVPSAANLDFYIGILREKFAQREALKATAFVQETIRGGGAELTAERELMQAVEVLQRVADDVSATNPVAAMKDLVREVVDCVEHSFKHRNKGLVHGSIATGFSYYDKKTCGIHPSELTIIGGRPGTGKTSLIVSLILNVAVQANVPVVFFSLEMTKRAIAERLLGAGAHVNMRQVHSGMCSESDLRAMVTFAPKLAKAPIFIDDTPGLTPMDLIARARRYVPMYKAPLVIVDHLHEINVPEARGDEKIQATASVVALKAIARRLGIGVVAAAQLSRTFEAESAKSRNRLPRSTDLRGSGNIEQIADVIGILHRDESDGEEEEDGKRERPRWGEMDEWPVNLEITKQRNGPTGPVKFQFERNCMLYRDRYFGRGTTEAESRETWR